MFTCMMATTTLRFSVLVLVLVPLLSEAIPAFSRRKWTGKSGMLLSIVANSSDKGAPEQWCEQKLDHFDYNNKNVWKQRFWINDTNWDRKKGPVILFIGGEGEADNKWLQFGEMMDLAQKYKAMAIILEHRFYGKSHPTKDMSLDNMKYLSSRQALEDMAHFRTYIAKNYSMTEDHRWIAFGGSYSGALAAWMRIKYPDIVYGAVATSAPVLAEYDFVQYLEVVEQSLLTTVKGKECVAAIHSAMEEIDTQSKDQKQWGVLNKRFHLKSPLKTDEDCKLLASDLAGIFMGVVQYNNDSRGNMSYDMNDLCNVMANTSLGEPLDRLTHLANITGITLESNFTSSLKELNETKWTLMGERQWIYQTCTEFGYFQTSDSKNQPFGSQITIDLYTLICQNVFNLTPDKVQENIKKTNEYYGGKNIPKNVTNIVFPNGSIDPWHALGITQDVSPDLMAVFINGTAHCANMYPSSKYDRPELLEARAQISSIMGQWLGA